MGAGRLLDGALGAAASVADGPVVLVGPPRAGLADDVVVVCEDPPGTGPVAALAAGLAGVGGAAIVLVLAGDLVAPADALPALLDTLDRDARTEAVVVVDAAGRRQPLLAAYRTAALAEALAGMTPLDGRAMRDVLGRLAVAEVPDPGAWSRDVDVPADLRTSS